MGGSRAGGQEIALYKVALPEDWKELMDILSIYGHKLNVRNIQNNINVHGIIMKVFGNTVQYNSYDHSTI